MDLECPICNELLYRIPQVTRSHPGYIMDILCEHRMQDTISILQELGYNGSSAESFEKAKQKYVNALITQPYSEWAVNIMIGFLKVIVAPCGHTFHFWCLKEWAEISSRRTRSFPTCPYCRAVIPMHKWRTIKYGQLIDIPERDSFRQKLRSKEAYAVEVMKTARQFEEYAAQLENNQATRMQKFCLWITRFTLIIGYKWKFNVSTNVKKKVQELLANPSKENISNINSYLASKINEITSLNQKWRFKKWIILFIAWVFGFNWILQFNSGREEADLVKFLYILMGTRAILSFIGCCFFDGMAPDNLEDLNGIQGKLEYLKDMINSAF